MSMADKRQDAVCAKMPTVCRGCRKWMQNAYFLPTAGDFLHLDLLVQAPPRLYSSQTPIQLAEEGGEKTI